MSCFHGASLNYLRISTSQNAFDIALLKQSAVIYVIRRNINGMRVIWELLVQLNIPWVPKLTWWFSSELKHSAQPNCILTLNSCNMLLHSLSSLTHLLIWSLHQNSLPLINLLNIMQGIIVSYLTGIWYVRNAHRILAEERTSMGTY